MTITGKQSECGRGFQDFARAEIEAHAAAWDGAQMVSAAGISVLRRSGYFGANIPVEFGGCGWDMVTFGRLHEAIGRADSGVADLLTVQAMVSSVLIKWGTAAQRGAWLPALASGEQLAAFAMTEPGCGSDLGGMTTELVRGHGDAFVIDGEKQWISGAQHAGIFLVFGKLENQPVACLVPRDSAGVEIEPTRDLMGYRTAGLGTVRFRKVHVPPSNLVGKPGFAFSHLAPHGLHIGRISTACSSLGLLRACVEASAGRAAARNVGGQSIGEFGMIQSMVARMGTALEAARLLCEEACRLADERHPDAMIRAMMAKLFASRAAAEAAADAVQIHGASGCHESSPVARYYRNAKITEIIEGTTQVHEAVIGKSLISRMGCTPEPERRFRELPGPARE